MNQRVRTLLYLCIAASVLGVAVWQTAPPPQERLASVSMLDVGQGDSILIQSASGTQLLIDGGPDEAVLTELADVLPPGDRTIDVVLATHPDADHIGGLVPVLERYEVSLFLAPDVSAGTALEKTLYQTILDRNIPSYSVRRGMILTLDEDTAFTILFPDRDTRFWKTNTASVVGRLQIGERSMLLTGDAPASIETVLAATDIDVDVLKLGHHGSKTSSTEIFLRATSPSLALLSAGVNNRYGHTAPEVVERLTRLGIPVVSTQNAGTYTVRNDGEKWYRP